LCRRRGVQTTVAIELLVVDANCSLRFARCLCAALGLREYYYASLQCGVYDYDRLLGGTPLSVTITVGCAVCQSDGLKSEWTRFVMRK